MLPQDIIIWCWFYRRPKGGFERTPSNSPAYGPVLLVQGKCPTHSMCMQQSDTRSWWAANSCLYIHSKFREESYDNNFGLEGMVLPSSTKKKENSVKSFVILKITHRPEEASWVHIGYCYPWHQTFSACLTNPLCMWERFGLGTRLYIYQRAIYINALSSKSPQQLRWYCRTRSVSSAFIDFWKIAQRFLYKALTEGCGLGQTRWRGIRAVQLSMHENDLKSVRLMPEAWDLIGLMYM